MFVGGSEEMLAKMKVTMLERAPDLRIAGMYAPPFGEWSPEDHERIIDVIRQSNATFVWVALGSPKQEHWIAKNKDRLPPAVYSAVGAAFAFHAAMVRQAPLWMQRSGLEWAFRLITEP